MYIVYIYIVYILITNVNTRSLTMQSTHPSVEIEMKEDGTAFLTLLHPVVPMSCYDNECSFTSNNCIGTRIATSFESHIFRKHNLRTSRRWKC